MKHSRKWLFLGASMVFVMFMAVAMSFRHSYIDTTQQREDVIFPTMEPTATGARMFAMDGAVAEPLADTMMEEILQVEQLSESVQPTPKVENTTSIQQKIFSGLRIDAQVKEPTTATFSIQKLTNVQFNGEAVLAALFFHSDAKRTSESMGHGRIDYRNSTGEFALIEPGRIDYCYQEDSYVKYYNLFPLIEHGNRKGWYLRDRGSLNKELSFQSREEASSFAEAYATALLPEGYPYTPRVEVVHALSLSEIKQLMKAARADELYPFSDLPGGEEGGVLQEGIYYIQLRMYAGEIPVFSYKIDTQPGSTTYAVYEMGWSPTIKMVLGAPGVLLYQSDGIQQPSETVQETAIIPATQAINSLFQYGRNLMQYDASVSVDEIYPMYASVRKGSGEKAQWYLWPIWCFKDSDFQGEYEHMSSYEFYLDAISGLPVYEMK